MSSQVVPVKEFCEDKQISPSYNSLVIIVQENLRKEHINEEDQEEHNEGSKDTHHVLLRQR